MMHAYVMKLGAYAIAADTFLWRNKKISAGVLGVAL